MTRSICVAVTVLTLACSGALGPADVAGPYRLDAIPGMSRPFLIAATVNCDQYLQEVRLRLDADRTYALTLEMVLDCSRAGGAIDPLNVSISGAFTLRDHRLTLRPDSLAVLPMSGWIDGRHLSLTLPAALTGIVGDLRVSLFWLDCSQGCLF